jgi:hypothetical protein
MAKRQFRLPRLIDGDRKRRWMPWLKRCWVFRVQYRDGYRMMHPQQVYEILEREGYRCTVGITEFEEFIVERNSDTPNISNQMEAL